MKIAVIMPVKVDRAWQIPMTFCAAATMRVTTETPFDLVVPYRAGAIPCDLAAVIGDGSFLPAREQDDSPTKEINAAIDYAVQALDATHIVYTGNDIFTRDGWLEALVEPWLHFPDTGCTTVWSSELNRNATPGVIIEGVYGPLMMFESSWRYDDAFPSQFGDTDLVMRLYAAGLRSYRNHGVVVHHLLRQTVQAEANEVDFEESKARFIAKHQGSPLLMFQILAGGKVV